MFADNRWPAISQPFEIPGNIYRFLRIIFLPPATKFAQGYVFTRVCDSVHRGVSATVHAGIQTPPTRGRHSPGRHHLPQADPPGQTPSKHPPAQCMLGYGQQAGDMHPTGMQSSQLYVGVIDGIVKR